MIFGLTDLRKNLSGAKFDAEADFEVRLAVAPRDPKPHQIKELSAQQKIEFFESFFDVLDVAKRRRRLEF